MSAPTKKKPLSAGEVLAAALVGAIAGGLALLVADALGPEAVRELVAELKHPHHVVRAEGLDGSGRPWLH